MTSVNWFAVWIVFCLIVAPVVWAAVGCHRERKKRRGKLIRNAQALLDLDAKKVLVPHGIGGFARDIICDFIAELK